MLLVVYQYIKHVVFTLTSAQFLLVYIIYIIKSCSLIENNYHSSEKSMPYDYLIDQLDESLLMLIIDIKSYA